MKKESKSLHFQYKNSAITSSPVLRISLPRLQKTSSPTILPSQSEDSFINVFEESFTKAKSPQLVGPRARLDFIDYYKSTSRPCNRVIGPDETSPTSAYIDSLVNLKLSPRSFGIVKASGAESNFDLRLRSMGDNYAAAFSQGIKHYPSLQTLNLKNNRLTDKGNEKILKTIDSRQIERLTLAENKIGPKSVGKIIEMVSTYECKLKYLNLEKTNISESTAVVFFNAVGNNKTLKKIILAKNNLTDRVAKNIKEMLEINKTLKVLDLHWNSFRSNGAALMFEGLSKNGALVILDLSWNSLGKNEAAFEVIGNAVKVNQSLLHLDLSYNYLTEKDCKILGEHLKSNHSLLGLHVLGNECSVDAKGFLVIDKIEKVEKSLFYRRIIEKQTHYNEVKSNCWVCEKWVELTFFCHSPGDSVFIHFEFENYKPELMFNSSPGFFEITRVVPPELVKFFFSELADRPVDSSYEKIQEELEIDSVIYDGLTKHLVLNSVLLTYPKGEICTIKSPFSTKPRTPDNKYSPPADKLERIKWSFKTSIFKDSPNETEKILNDCFEFDWKHSRIPNFIRNPDEQENVKKILRSFYPLIKNTYKILCAYSGNDVFSIGTNVLNEFFNQCKIYDSLYQASDFGVNLNSTLVPKEKGQVYNPGNSLVRYEFLEVLVRIAMDKYIRNKICASYTQAIQKLINDSLVSIMSEYKINEWRAEEYYREEVDLVLKANKELFLMVFKRYSGKYTLPGKKNFMSIEEFRQLCLDCGLVGDNFAARESDVCFCQAMNTQVDELYSKKHMEMGFLEFLEAICRAVDLSGGFDCDKSKINSLIQSSLSLKIESLLVWLLKTCPQSFQDEYKIAGSEYYSKMMYKFVPGRG